MTKEVSVVDLLCGVVSLNPVCSVRHPTKDEKSAWRTGVNAFIARTRPVFQRRYEEASRLTGPGERMPASEAMAILSSAVEKLFDDADPTLFKDTGYKCFRHGVEDAAVCLWRKVGGIVLLGEPLTPEEDEAA